MADAVPMHASARCYNLQQSEVEIIVIIIKYVLE